MHTNDDFSRKCDVKMEEEETAYKWTVEKTRQLVRLRTEHDSRFTKKRNAAKQTWEFFIKEMGLEGKVTPKQASKKWENLQKKYKELRKPTTGSGSDQGKKTASTWPYYADLHEALGSRPSISPPVLVSSCLSDPTILPPLNAGEPAPSSTPPSPMPSTSGPSSAPSSNVSQKTKADTIMDFLHQEAAKEDRRHSEIIAQNEKFLKVFEKMVDKM